MKNVVNIDKYYKIIEPKTKVEVYNLGYIDGYFNETVYLDYIKDKDLEVYISGKSFGEKTRNETASKAIIISKKRWLCKLAISDAVNGIGPRNVSEEFLNDYMLDYNDVSSGSKSEVDSRFFEDCERRGEGEFNNSYPFGFKFYDEEKRVR